MDALAREKMMAPGTAYRYTAPRTLAAMFVGAERVVLGGGVAVALKATCLGAGIQAR